MTTAHQRWGGRHLISNTNHTADWSPWSHHTPGFNNSMGSIALGNRKLHGDNKIPSQRICWILHISAAAHNTISFSYSLNMEIWFMWRIGIIYISPRHWGMFYINTEEIYVYGLPALCPIKFYGKVQHIYIYIERERMRLRERERETHNKRNRKIGKSLYLWSSNTKTQRNM